MNIYPANERRISEVERGRRCNAILALPPGKSLSAGDSVVFALALPSPDQEPRYVRCGDSVRVLLSAVTDLQETDPATGRALFRLSWEPLGRAGSAGKGMGGPVEDTARNPRPMVSCDSTPPPGHDDSSRQPSKEDRR